MNRKNHDHSPDMRPFEAASISPIRRSKGDCLQTLPLIRKYLDMGCYSSAASALNAAIEKDTVSPELWLAAALYFRQWGDHGLAEDALQIGLQQEEKGRCAAEMQQLLTTLQQEKESIPFKNARVNTLESLLIKAMAKKKKEKALQLAKALWKKQRTGSGALGLGQLLLPASRALIPLTVACRLNPCRVIPRLQLARALECAGSKQQARTQMLIAMQLCSTLFDAESFCKVAWRMNMADEALALSEANLARHPFSIDYLLLKYLSLRHLQREHEASIILQQAMKYDPDHPLIAYYLKHPNDLMLHPQWKEDHYTLSAKTLAIRNDWKTTASSDAPNAQ